MLIEKSTLVIGDYVASQKNKDGRMIVGVGKSHTKAMADCFQMLEWVSPFKNQAEEDIEAEAVRLYNQIEQ